jgi:hypothetical protein
MRFDFDTIEKLVRSPPGELVAGAALAGIVWKFFEKVEAVLNEDTKLEIALWLLDVGVGREMKKWHDTFSTIFYRIFGRKAISWTAVASSSIVTICTLIVMNIFNIIWGEGEFLGIREALAIFPLQIIVNLAPDFLSVAATRFFLGRLQGLTKIRTTIGILLANTCIALLIALVALSIMMSLQASRAYEVLYDRIVYRATPAEVDVAIAKEFSEQPEVLKIFMEGRRGRVAGTPVLLASLFTSIWTWLYITSAFLLNLARRFDIGFQWFNQKFDIEKKPLSAIGLVAGALVSLVYWGAAIGAHLMNK